MWAAIFFFIVVVVAAIWYYTKGGEMPFITEQPVIESTTPIVTATPTKEEYDHVRGAMMHPRNTDPGYTDYAGRVGAEAYIPLHVHWWTVGQGKAKSYKDCIAASTAAGHKNWLWDKQAKGCHAYNDETWLVLSQHGDAWLNKDTRNSHEIGCTDPDVKVAQGCHDWTKGDMVRGLPINGGYAEITPRAHGISFENCRAKAKALGHDAILYANQGHTWGDHANRCYAVNDATSLEGQTSVPTDLVHMTACTDPSKKVIHGCQ